MKKPGVGIIVFMIALFMLLLAGGILVPKLLDMRSVKDEIRLRAQKDLGADIDFERLGFDIFPYPRVVAQQIKLSMPPNARGTAASLIVRPEIRPLFLGKLKIIGLYLDSAEFDYTLPQASQQAASGDWAKKISSVVSMFSKFSAADMAFRVDNASVNLFQGGRKRLSLTEVNARLAGPPESPLITVGCASDLWENISIKARLEPHTPKSGDPPQIILQANGTAVDVASVRQAALALFEKNEAVRGLFDIVTRGRVPSIILDVKGPLTDTEKWRFDLSGDVDGLVLDNLPGLPVPLTVVSGKFSADPEALTVTEARAAFLDAVLAVSSKHPRYLEGFDKKGALDIAGDAGPEATRWVSDLIRMPSWIKLRPFTLSPSRLAWDESGTTMFSGALRLRGGPGVSVDVVHRPDRLNIQKIFIQDEASRATFGLDVDKRIYDLSFDGRLDKSTLDQLVPGNDLLSGWIDGNVRARFTPEIFSQLRLTGNLTGHGLVVPVGEYVPAEIASFSISGSEDKIVVDSAELAWGDTKAGLSGSVMPIDQGRLRLDIDIAADTVDLNRLAQSVNTGGVKRKERQVAPASLPLTVEGRVRFKADRFTIGGYTWQPLHADVKLNRGSADINIKEAVICGISTPGSLNVSPQNVAFNLEAVAEGQELNPALNCFSGKNLSANGTYTVKGTFNGRGRPGDLLNASEGYVELTAVDGRIFQDIILLNVLKFLAVSKVLTGAITAGEMTTKGFGYRSFRMKARLKDGRVLVEKAVLDGRQMTVTAAGKHDLRNGRMDLSLLVAPLKTVDRILDYIPGADVLDTIPIGVKGTVPNLRIYPLAPSAVEIRSA